MDASLDKTTNIGSIAWIALDSTTNTKSGKRQCFHSNYVLLTESQACFHAMT